MTAPHGEQLTDQPQDAMWFLVGMTMNTMNGMVRILPWPWLAKDLSSI